MIFNQARAIARKFAFVHIASAKFELETLGKLSSLALKVPTKFVTDDMLIFLFLFFFSEKKIPTFCVNCLVGRQFT